MTGVAAYTTARAHNRAISMFMHDEDLVEMAHDLNLSPDDCAKFTDDEWADIYTCDLEELPYILLGYDALARFEFNYGIEPWEGDDFLDEREPVQPAPIVPITSAKPAKPANEYALPSAFGQRQQPKTIPHYLVTVW